jgi:hypothetical protein
MHERKSCVFGGGKAADLQPRHEPGLRGAVACVGDARQRVQRGRAHSAAHVRRGSEKPLENVLVALGSPPASQPLDILSQSAWGGGQRARGVHLLRTKLQSFHGRLAHPLRPRRPSPPLRARVAEARAAARRGGASGGGRRRGGASARAGAGAPGAPGASLVRVAESGEDAAADVAAHVVGLTRLADPGVGPRGRALARGSGQPRAPALAEAIVGRVRELTEARGSDLARGRVQLVRRDGRDVSTLYGREGGGGGRAGGRADICQKTESSASSTE